MRNIILIIFIITLFSFKSYENVIDNELKKFMVGQLQILELAKDKKNISNLVFKNSLGEDKSFSEFKGNILLVNFTMKKVFGTIILNGYMQQKKPVDLRLFLLLNNILLIGIIKTTKLAHLYGKKILLLQG